MSRKWTAPRYDTFQPDPKAKPSETAALPLHLAHATNPADNTRGIGRILFVHLFAQMPLTLLIHFTASATSFRSAAWFFGAIAGLLLFTALIKALRFDGLVAQIPGALYTVGVVGILLVALVVFFWMLPGPGQDRFPSFAILLPVLIGVSLLTSLWPGFITALGGYRDFTRQAHPTTLLIGGLSVFGALGFVYASASLPLNVLRYVALLATTAFAVVVAFEGAALLRANPCLSLQQVRSRPFSYESLSAPVYACLVGLGLILAAIVAFDPVLLANLGLPVDMPRQQSPWDAYRIFVVGLLFALLAIQVVAEALGLFRCSWASFPGRCFLSFKVTARALFSFITYNPKGVAHPLTHQIQTAWLRSAQARTLLFSLVLWINAVPILASFRSGEANVDAQPGWPLTLTVFFAGPSVITFLNLLVVCGPLLAVYQTHFETNGFGSNIHQPVKRGGSKR